MRNQTIFEISHLQLIELKFLDILFKENQNFYLISFTFFNKFDLQLQYGDTMTNIVVVQFSDYVQTGRDKRFNLTCLFRGPGEAVVTSGYIGAGYARSYRLRNRVLHPVHLIKQSDRRSTNLECKMYRIPLPHESWCKHT